MSDASLATSSQPTRQQLAAQGRTLPGKVTGRLKVAVHAMVWLGMKRAEAAKEAGLQEQSLYVALSRPHVRGYYLRQLEVLRTSERARNIHALCDVRDGSNAMARVNAVKALEQLSEEQSQSRGGSVASPGFVIVINNGPQSPAMQTIEPKPLIRHEAVSGATRGCGGQRADIVDVLQSGQDSHRAIDDAAPGDGGGKLGRLRAAGNQHTQLPLKSSRA